MKKIVSVLLVAVLLVCICVISVGAGTVESEYLYKNKFIEYEIQSLIELVQYDEKYYHLNKDGDIDWALIYAYTNLCADTPGWMLIDDRIILTNSLYYPFVYCYGVYDAEVDDFIAISENMDLSKYEGLEDILSSTVGIPIGDADLDYNLTIMDATYIQRVMAGLCEFSSRDCIDYYGSPLKYISDLDRDGERTIFDATAIQMKLAKVESK